MLVYWSLSSIRVCCVRVRNSAKVYQTCMMQLILSLPSIRPSTTSGLQARHLHWNKSSLRVAQLTTSYGQATGPIPPRPIFIEIIPNSRRSPVNAFESPLKRTCPTELCLFTQITRTSKTYYPAQEYNYNPAICLS
jgi:hypothetical protein